MAISNGHLMDDFLSSNGNLTGTANGDCPINNGDLTEMGPIFEATGRGKSIQCENRGDHPCNGAAVSKGFFLKVFWKKQKFHP